MCFCSKKNCDITRNDKQIGFSALILQYTDNNMGNVWSFDNLNSNFWRKKDEIILGTKDFHSRAQLEISESWTRSDKPSYLLPLSDQSSAVSVMRLFFGQIINRSSGHDLCVLQGKRETISKTSLFHSYHKHKRLLFISFI